VLCVSFLFAIHMLIINLIFVYGAFRVEMTMRFTKWSRGSMATLMTALGMRSKALLIRYVYARNCSWIRKRVATDRVAPEVDVTIEV
jgi:hypothetical protein